MIKVIIDKKEFFLPESWNEMSTVQLEYLTELLVDPLSATEVKVKLLLHILGISHDWRGAMRLGRKRCPIVTEDVYVASQVFDFLFAKNEEGQEYLHPTLTRCPYEDLPTVVGATPPGNALSGINYQQYIYALSYSEMLLKEPRAIHPLIESLYTKNAPHLRVGGDVPTAGLSVAQCYVIRWYWQGSMLYLADRFPKLFAPSGGGSSQHFNSYEAQEQLLDMMTQGDASRKESYKRLPLYSVLYSLNYIYENPTTLQSPRGV